MRTIGLGLTLVLAAAGGLTACDNAAPPPGGGTPETGIAIRSGPAGSSESGSASAALLAAVKTGDAQQVDALLERGADVDAAEADGTTALIWAIQSRNPEIARRLIDRGADVQLTNRYGVSALYTAARNGDAEATRALLAAGVDPNTSLPEGETALMTAAKTGNPEVVRLLLAGGAESGSRNSALADAGAGGYEGYGADPNATETWQGQTALMWAAAAGRADAMRALIEGGADVDAFSSMIVAPTLPPGRSDVGGFAMIPKGRMTALHLAAREGQLEAARVLIEAGADLDAVDEYGSNAMILATINGHLDVTGALLDAGADPNIADEWGRTVLFAAVDLNTLDLLPRPLPKVSSERSAFDIVDKALENGAEPDPTLKKTLPTLVVVGGARSSVLREGATPFLRAAMAADLPIMRRLLEGGADPVKATDEREKMDYAPDGNMSDVPNGLTTPFLAAAGIGWRHSISRGRETDAIEALNMLLDLGAKIDEVNQSGDTALHAATFRGSIPMMQFLIDRGVEVNAVNGTGWTALDIALGQPDPNYRIPYNEATTRFLREQGAKTAEELGVEKPEAS